MAYVNEEGVYRCRLAQDAETGKACIDVTEHYAWDYNQKKVDTNKSLGGLQVLLKADAWLIGEDGEPVGERLDLNLNPFGYTIVTKRELGEKTLVERVNLLVEALGLTDASELVTLDSVDNERLLSATFDIRVWHTASKQVQGKYHTNYYIAPIGKAQPKPKSFAVPSNGSTLDRFRAKLRVDCAGTKPATPAPSTASKPALPSRPAPTPAPAKKAPSLPPRTTVSADNWTADKLWDCWYNKHQDDTQGDAFYGALREMYGDAVQLDQLSAEQFSAFAIKHELSATDDDAEMPF